MILPLDDTLQCQGRLFVVAVTTPGKCSTVAGGDVWRLGIRLNISRGREQQGTTRNCSLIINCANIEKASFLVIGCFEIPTSRVHIA